MSVLSAIAGFARPIVIAAVTAGAAFGLLAVFHPFSPPQAVATAVDSSSSDVLHARIEKARVALSDTEAALDNVNSAVPVGSANPDATRAQYEAQIAAATERRDLARRHAAAIRAGLTTGLPLASLAEIRDSVVVGQLLSQQAALEAEIAEQGARFKPSHPVMRALLAQRDALAVQIRAQAASIAAALESEADLDDQQITLLQSQLAPVEAAPIASPALSTAALQSKAAAQRAELDALMDAYFKLPAATVPQPVTTSAPVVSPLNLIVVAVAGIAALVFQIALATRRRRLRAEATDLAQWQADNDEPQLPLDLPAAAEAPLRRAS